MITREGIREFGIKRDNEERRDGGCAVVYDPETQKLAIGVQENKMMRLFSGGVSSDEDIVEGILREVREESGLTEFLSVEKIAEAYAHFGNTLKNVNRFCHATCILVILKNKKLIPTKLESHEKFHLEFVTKDELLSNWHKFNNEKNLDHWFYFLDLAENRLKELQFKI